MALSWFDRLLKTKSRPAPRRRPAHARLGVEALETRLVPTVVSVLTPAGQLLVSDTSAVDTVTLDHSGSTTFVNGVGFADSLITNGILIQVGSGVGNLDTVNILATAKPVTVNGQADVGAVNLGGKAGIGAQGIVAPVSLTNLGAKDFTGSPHFYDLTVDDSANPFGRTVTLNAGTDTGTITNLATGPISFDESGLGNLDIKGGSGNNTFNVL